MTTELDPDPLGTLEGLAAAAGAAATRFDQAVALLVDELQPDDAARLQWHAQTARRWLGDAAGTLLRHVGRSGATEVRFDRRTFRVLPTWRDRWDIPALMRLAEIDSVEKVQAVFNLTAPRKTVLKQMLDPNECRELLAETCQSEQTGWTLRETGGEP